MFVLEEKGAYLVVRRALPARKDAITFALIDKAANARVCTVVQAVEIVAVVRLALVYYRV